MSTWAYRGTDLDDIGIVTKVSDSFKMPTRRGDNVVIPDQDGAVFQEKRFGERVMQLGLEIVEDSRENLEEKIDTAKALFGARGLGLLEQTLENESVRTIEAEYTGDLDPTPVSPNSVRMLLEFRMPDPFFRGEDEVSSDLTIDASPKSWTFNNPGTAYERKPRIVLLGPLNNVVITNTTNDVIIRYNASIADGDYVTIEKNEHGEWTAIDNSDEIVIANVSHEGDSSFFVLEAGDNELEIEDDTATTGVVRFEFFAPYL